jgi:hypothetical protein
MLQKTHEINRGIDVIFATDGCPTQLYIVKKICYKSKPKGQGLSLQGFCT